MPVRFHSERDAYSESQLNGPPGSPSSIRFELTTGYLLPGRSTFPEPGSTSRTARSNRSGTSNSSIASRSGVDERRTLGARAPHKPGAYARARRVGGRGQLHEPVVVRAEQTQAAAQLAGEGAKRLRGVLRVDVAAHRSHSPLVVEPGAVHGPERREIDSGRPGR